MPPTVLCAQGDRTLFQIHSQALVGDGYRVIPAHDGQQALDCFRAERPDLVVIDVLLPKRDGFDVLAAIREMPEPAGLTPVLLLSSCSVSPEYRQRADAMGAIDILAKPIALELLLGHARNIVKAPGAVAGRAARSAAPPMRGTLAEIDFASLLHQLHGLRASGVLVLESGKKKKAIQLKDGYPVAVKSNLVGECFGNMLVRQGRILQQDLDESVRRVRKGEGLQGEVLIAMQVLGEQEVSVALREQAAQKLYEVFTWQSGSYGFEVGKRLQGCNSLALDLSPAELVVEGVRQHVPLERIDAFIVQHAARPLIQGQNPFYRFQEIALSAEEERVISQLDGKRRLCDFAQAPERVRRTLFGLLKVELLELRDAAGAAPATKRPPRSSPAAGAADAGLPDDTELRRELAALAAELRGRSHFEVLGLPTTADDDAVNEAYEKLARRVHPDRFHRASDAIRRLADEIYQLATRAHEALATPARRAECAGQLRDGPRNSREQANGRRTLNAESAFQQGEASLRQRDYESALLFFGRAVEHYPEDGEYHAHYGWCLHLCHPDNEVMLEEAIEHVRRGIKLARDREKPYLFLGRLYKVEGKTDAAEKMFARALQIRPESVDALRELRLMNMRRDKNKGLIRRLLRR